MDVLPPAAIVMRSYMGDKHLYAAKLFHGLAFEIEDAHSGHPVFDNSHWSYVVGSVLSSVAYLEATINEVLLDAADGHLARLEHLDSESIDALASFWSIGGERKSVLEKYQSALLVATKSIFDTGCQPYQDVDLLRRLRNLLVHSTPESAVAGETHKLEQKLGNKFHPNRLMNGAKNPYFPSHCLGEGCAKWAIGSCESFVAEFRSRIGLQGL